VELLHLPNSHGKVDLAALLRALGQRHINEVHVEAGLKLHASLLREACVDELLLYLAPKILGDAQNMFALPALQALADLPAQQQCKFHAIEQIGTDLRILARL
jgi:diaminohydroxyphosphoribosylaminopyrimidine deaminase/5-amino-6-(5-phosphoribosylamino)uracil reductase